MIQKYNIYKVVEVFLNDAIRGYRLREISRLIKLGLPSVVNYVKYLEKNNLVIQKNIHGSKLYFAERENRKFKLYKKFHTINLLFDTGIVDYLEKELDYPTITLYGSHALGEDIKESDIDLILITPIKKELKLDKFEKMLNKKIHFFIYNRKEFEKLKKQNKELLNNILNGVIISGYLKVF